MQIHINHINTVYALKEDIDSLYEYMSTLSEKGDHS